MRRCGTSLFGLVLARSSSFGGLRGLICGRVAFLSSPFYLKIVLMSSFCTNLRIAKSSFTVVNSGFATSLGTKIISSLTIFCVLWRCFFCDAPHLTPSDKKKCYCSWVGSLVSLVSLASLGALGALGLLALLASIRANPKFLKLLKLLNPP